MAERAVVRVAEAWVGGVAEAEGKAGEAVVAVARVASRVEIEELAKVAAARVVVAIAEAQVVAARVVAAAATAATEPTVVVAGVVGPEATQPDGVEAPQEATGRARLAVGRQEAG